MNQRLILGAGMAVPLLLVGTLGQAGTPNTARQALLDGYAVQAKQADPGFHGFSAQAGQGFFLAHPASARPETPSCAACHTTSPVNPGRTRAGKDIQPMAVSRTPDRFTDATKVERWFTRNCRTVYGRACTAVEKGNFITFMSSL